MSNPTGRKEMKGEPKRKRYVVTVETVEKYEIRVYASSEEEAIDNYRKGRFFDPAGAQSGTSETTMKARLDD